MPDPKKQSPIEQLVDVLKGLVSEPVTDQSSMAPTPADVRRVKAAMTLPRRKTAGKLRPKAATKKKRATTTRKATRRKGSSKKSTVRVVKRRKSARK